MEEILNIEYHQKEMTLKALNRACCSEGAARMLGIDVRTLYEWKDCWNIRKERGEWKIQESKVLNHQK